MQGHLQRGFQQSSLHRNAHRLRYYCLLTVSLDGQPSKRTFLRNDKLATSDSKDSLVHVVE
jgi:hypothetical protein